MSTTLIKTVEGIEIFVNEEGKFSAEVRGKVISKRNLRDVEKEIEAIASPVVAYEVRYNGPAKVEIVRFEKGRARLKNGSLNRAYERMYLMDIEALSRAEEIVERKRKIEDEWQKFLESLPLLTEKNFSEVRKAQSKK